LKGFTHNGKQLFIYDKKKDEVRPGNIENSFTLWTRNTVTWPNGERSDWLEDMYASIESDSAYLFPKIINSTPQEEAYTYLDKLMLSMFVAALFWRVPSMDQHIGKMINDEGFKNRRFYLEYPEGWSEADKKRMESLLLRDPAFQKIYPLFLIFEPYFEKDYSRFLDDWKFYYHDPGRFFAADVPAITRTTSDPKTILNEFILPLAPNRILVASKGKPLQIDREWTLHVDLQLINQAERYVCSNDELFLRAMVDLYKSEGHTPGSSHLRDLVFQVVS
jgi:hypothetical protein